MLLAAAMTLAAGGCWSTPDGFGSPDPNKRIQAILDAAAAGRASDDEVTSELIDELESVDPAARMLAIIALQDRTGQTFGYHHAAPEYERGAAVARWRAWAAERNATDAPGSGAPSGRAPSGELPSVQATSGQSG